MPDHAFPLCSIEITETEAEITFQPIGALTRALILQLARKRVGARYTGGQSVRTEAHESITGYQIEVSGSAAANDETPDVVQNAATDTAAHSG